MTMKGRRRASGKQGAFRRWASMLRRIAGMPDYQAYIAHLHQCHPDRPVPTEREYYELYLDGRYRNGGGRCC